MGLDNPVALKLDDSGDHITAKRDQTCRAGRRQGSKRPLGIERVGIPAFLVEEDHRAGKVLTGEGDDFERRH
jgi:hypothetical protein